VAASKPPQRRSATPLGLRLPELDFDLANAARRVIEGSLGVVAGERVAIVVDSEREPLGNTLAEIVRLVGGEPELVKVETLGSRPIRSVPERLHTLLSRAQASLLLIGFQDGELPMRKEYVGIVTGLGLRHAHMVGIGRRSMLAGFSVDPQRILHATGAVRMRLRPDSVLRLRSPAGSDLEVRLDPKHRWQERLGIIRPGRWENLPSGQLYTCPGDVNGVFVADASMGGPFASAGSLDATPVRVDIKSGTCRAVECADRVRARAVEDALRADPNGDRVGIVALGTNVGLRESTGELICDQNMPGLHLGFGATFPEKTGAGWDAPSQLSMSGTRADLDLDGEPLIRQGRYLVL